MLVAEVQKGEAELQDCKCKHNMLEEAVCRWKEEAKLL
jgi:hypothetical protein